MIIDDDSDDREIFIDAVSGINCSIEFHSAKSDGGALEKLSSMEKLTDFIFLDLNMPLMIGKQFLKLIKAIEGLRDIPIMGYSTSSSQKDINETKDLGAFSYLVKQNILSVLRKKLSELLC